MLGKIINVVSGLAVAGGFVLAIGTCGSADLNLINFSTLVIRLGISVALIVVGAIGFQFGEPIYIDCN